MPKSKSSQNTTNVHRLIWPLVAIVSLVVNGIFIGGWLYVTQVNQIPLLQAAVTKLCAEPGYSQWMKRIDEQATDSDNSKKFAAAGVCFTDYESGKILDITKLQPVEDTTPNLPARP